MSELKIKAIDYVLAALNIFPNDLVGFSEHLKLKMEENQYIATYMDGYTRNELKEEKKSLQEEKKSLQDEKTYLQKENTLRQEEKVIQLRIRGMKK
jgi:FtsZ-binding cell division protein ZapB